MTTVDSQQASPTLSQEARDDMEKYGITRVPVDYFHHGKYRYTNLEDAIAEAKRDQTSN